MTWQLVYNKIHKQDVLTTQSPVCCVLFVGTDSPQKIKKYMRNILPLFNLIFWGFRDKIQLKSRRGAIHVAISRQVAALL